MKFSSDSVTVFNSISEFSEYIKLHPETLASLSPGGAAGRLGITRQAVHKLINRGKLKTWIVYDEEARKFEGLGKQPCIILISKEDIEKWLDHSRDGRGSKPNTFRLTR